MNIEINSSNGKWEWDSENECFKPTFILSLRSKPSVKDYWDFEINTELTTMQGKCQFKQAKIIYLLVDQLIDIQKKSIEKQQIKNLSNDLITKMEQEQMVMSAYRFKNLLEEALK